MPRVRLEPLPPEEAIAFFRSKHDLPSFDWRDLWQAEHAAAFTVAKSTGFDILADVRGAVDAALADGTTLATFKKRLEPTLRAAGWWGRGQAVDPSTGELVDATLGTPRRLATIYRTNLRTAYAAGQWERIERVKSQRPYLMYVTARDDRVRDEHRQWDGLVLPVDDPWWRTHRPPNGWGCRCSVIQLSAAQLRARGLEVGEAPPVQTRAWRNKRTGAVERVPVGIDPGWAYNPGATRGPQLGRVLAAKLEAMEPAMARAAVQGMLAGPGMTRLMAGKPDAVPLPVAVLPERLSAAIGAPLHAVQLSAYTADKQGRNHPDVQPGDYRQVQSILDRGQAFVEGGTHVVAFLAIAGRLWQAVVKRSRDARELYLASFRRSDEQSRARAERRGERVD